MNAKPMRRVDFQVAVFSAVLVIVASAMIFLVSYTLTFRDTIESLTQRVYSIYDYVEDQLDKETFRALSEASDLDTELYKKNHDLMVHGKQAANVMYLYTATRNEAGEFVYLMDGLPLGVSDFRYPGDPIEPEIIPEIQRAMAGEAVLPSQIKPTDWGKIFIAYLPVHDGEEVVGVVGVEFDAEHQYNTFRQLRIAAPLIIFTTCLLAAGFAVFFFRRISNPSRKDLYNTDHLTQLKSRNAFDVVFHNVDVIRERNRMGILLADLNYLKQVNDRLGHQCGDDYIKAVAGIFQELLPENGVAYRVGGDEFAVLLWDASLEDLETLAQAVAQTYLDRRPDWPVETSLAVGCALFAEDQDEDLNDTYRRADEALYTRKSEQHKKMPKQ